MPRQERTSSDGNTSYKPGVAVCSSDNPPVPAVHVYTDASGSFGAGGVWAPHLCFQLRWPPTWTTVDIVVKELVPVVVAAALWGRHWYHSHTCFHVDNEAVVSILQRQSGRSAIV